MKLFQIINKEKLLLFNNKYELIWETSKQNFYISGIVSSEDKQNFLIIFRSKTKKNFYILRYYDSIDINSNYEEIEIETKSQISSMSIKKHFIAYSLLNSKTDFYILEKKNKEWVTTLKQFSYKEQMSNLVYTTSLKFFTEFYILQTFYSSVTSIPRIEQISLMASLLSP